jgi:hypothetical protein
MEKINCYIGIIAMTILGAIPPFGLSLHAEVRNVSLSEKVERTSTELPAAFYQLKDALILESAYVGFVGSLSENLVYLRDLLGNEKAEELMLQLYEAGSLPAKLYAIIGLQLLDKNEQAQSYLLDAEKFQKADIQSMEGCIIYTTKVGDLLPRIASGYYREQFKER